jgi:hypothetical protein
MSSDSADGADKSPAVEVIVDGIPLADLFRQLPLSRGSVFELIKALGIVTTSGKGPGGKGRVSWVSGADVARLREAAAAVHRKERKIADFAHGLQRQQLPRTLAPEPSAESEDHADARQLLRRLDAAEKALRMGFPLTTAELTWILGVRPGAGIVTRAGIQASRNGRNVWRLELSADSPDEPGNPG